MSSKTTSAEPSSAAGWRPIQPTVAEEPDVTRVCEVGLAVVADVFDIVDAHPNGGLLVGTLGDLENLDVGGGEVQRREIGYGRDRGAREDAGDQPRLVIFSDERVEGHQRERLVWRRHRYLAQGFDGVGVESALRVERYPALIVEEDELRRWLLRTKIPKGQVPVVGCGKEVLLCQPGDGFGTPPPGIWDFQLVLGSVEDPDGDDAGPAVGPDDRKSSRAWFHGNSIVFGADEPNIDTCRGGIGTGGDVIAAGGHDDRTVRCDHHPGSTQHGVL